VVVSRCLRVVDLFFFFLKDVKNNYRELTPSLQDVEQMSNQILTIVGQNGKQSIRREWEHVQVKSHQINTTILKVCRTNNSNLFLFFIPL
jgi:hypothetical protein